MRKEIYRNENPDFTIWYNENNVPAGRWSIEWEGKEFHTSSLYSAIQIARTGGLISHADQSRLQALLGP